MEQNQVIEITRINYPPKPVDVARDIDGCLYMVSMEELAPGKFKQEKVFPMEDTVQTFEIDGNEYRLTIPQRIPRDSLVLPTGFGCEVEAKDLLSRILFLVSEVVQFPSEQDALLVALYLLSTYTYDLNQELGYLAFTGSPGNGKSQALKACSQIAFSSLLASGGDSDASMLRQIDSIKGTLLIDEAQKSGSDTNSLYHKILVQGNQSSGTISRMEVTRKNDKMVIVPFSVFGPKIFAGRSIPGDEAILSRTYEINMKPGVSVASLVDLQDKDWLKAVELLRNDLLFYRQKLLLKGPHSKQIELLKKFRSDENFKPREKQVYKWLVLNCPDSQVFEKLTSSINLQRNRVKDIRSNQFEIQVLLATLSQFKKTSSSSRVLMKEIAAELEQWGHKSTDSRYITKILRDNQLATSHSKYGTCLARGITEREISQALRHHSIDPETLDVDQTSSPTSPTSLTESFGDDSWVLAE